ncbi:M23 family metallopeptidase [Paenibacillus sp. D2_2]|uniref:M23 family metallopeptidase n=1 Tax=Paenibacillus sp. D2_2 TaxID=3073092 RepID=UPI002814BAE7|nr:M23 family metallopeptidase [Paenibacillus sp. D2_2]WMT39289.1 M23 family metallopeptidase [Paenibacillus sp. D2_2]
MIPISEDVRRVISQRLKLGEKALPRVRVEVDRLAFIPGRTEEFRYVINDGKVVTKSASVWIAESTDGVFDGSTTANSQDICFPVQGKTIDTITITDEFGAPRDGGKRPHKGIDLWEDIGTPILAAWEGKVVNITRDRTKGGGFTVNLKHAGGIMTKYFHLSEINCSLDDIVTQGQMIGKLGNTGEVYSNGKLVDEAARAAGKGRHLHFEIWEGVNQDSRIGDGGKAVNPKAYLMGLRKMYGDTVTTGNVIDGGSVSGYLGEIKLSENFDKRNWYEKDVYSRGLNFADYVSVDSGWTLYDSGGKILYTFAAPSSAKVDFDIDLTKLSMPTEGVLNIGFGTNFTSSDEGDAFQVIIDDKAFANVKNFKGTELVELKNLHIPANSKQIKIRVIYGGKRKEYGYGYTEAKTMAIDYIRIQELLPSPPLDDKSEEGLDPTKGYLQQFEYGEFLNNSPTKVDTLQVGSFVYMDTQVLPNIISVEVDNQYESEAMEARITISNPRGFFSPEYNPAYFPELVGLTSPWSYFVNGFHVGVLSENTPIRIYMGYGQHLMRVFTGLIDKVDMTGEGSTLDISARDMYKRLIEKVISEKKAYPEVTHVDNVPDPVPPAGGDRLTQIIMAAQTQSQAYGIPDHKFLLAICKHETVLGTKGMGTVENGSFILGYGCYSAGYCDPKYKGIQAQMMRGAERMSKALASKGKKVSSKADVLYFHDGGDIAPMVWSGDRDNWVDRVWKYYQEMLSSPNDWARTSSTQASAPAAAQPMEMEKPAWVKSSVVIDLIKHGGLSDGGQQAKT